MSKYDPLWRYVVSSGGEALKLTFAEAQAVAGFPIDHAFLNCKKELAAYGWRVGKISLKEETVLFEKLPPAAAEGEPAMDEMHFTDLTAENLAEEHLCCIIRSRAPHPGVEAKRAWLAERLREGHVLRKLDAKGAVFIEYAPLETAWVPVEGENYIYIYCLWADGAFKGHGYGRALLASCIADAKAQGKAGVCLLGAERQKHWLTSGDFAKKHGFTAADRTDTGYELLALSFDGTLPRFTEGAKRGSIEREELTVYYDRQCPYIPQFIEAAQALCAEQGVPASFLEVDILEKAKALPCPFNNCAVFYNGKFQTVNLPDTAYLKRLLGL